MSTSDGRAPSSETPLPSSFTPNCGDSPHLRLLSALGRAAKQDLRRSRRIFVNRSTRMDHMDLIGFDMDYTLAIYNQPAIEALSVACTLKKMIEHRGHSKEILGLIYDPVFAIRGLVVDRQAGNVLKMDRYGHVGRCYHGSRLVERDERARLYREHRIRLSHPRYAWIDTLFALPEAVMFARLVELVDRDLAKMHAAVGHGDDEDRGASALAYDRLWRDIRESIDEAHQDESIKRVIKSDLGGYLEKDPDLAPTLHRFRSAGKRLFLLTNSGLDYTEKVMSYLLDGELPNYVGWRAYFDAIVVDARKPAFFSERNPLFELDDQGNRLREVGPGDLLRRGRIYQGGNIGDFQRQAGASGDRVLYVGDHIYGDMLRAKKSSVWRTAMIIQELESELTQQAQAEEPLQRLEALERRRTRIDTEMAYQQMLLLALQRPSTPPDLVPDMVISAEVVEAAISEMRHRLDGLRQTYRETTDAIEALEQEIEGKFNPYWGPLFKAGMENSRFGEQVEDYACLYTSRVSNFLSYSPLHYFRSPRDHLPHERVY